MSKIPSLKGWMPVLSEEEDTKFLPRQVVYVADRNKKAVAIDMKLEGGEWYYKLLSPWHGLGTEWQPSGETFFPNAFNRVESFILHESDNYTMAKTALEKQVIDGISILSQEMLFKLKRAVDGRVTDIIKHRVAVLMDEHKLTGAECNYVAVLLAQANLDSSTQNKNVADKSYNKSTAGLARLKFPAVRADKCEAVKEQIITIQNAANGSAP